LQAVRKFDLFTGHHDLSCRLTK